MSDHEEIRENGRPILERVLSAIMAGRVRMRPKWHFVLHAALGATGVAIALLALLWFAGFILFTLRETGVWLAPFFGPRGWFVFFASVPWLIVVLSLVFLVVLEFLVQRYSFAHRRPLLYSVLGIVFVVVVGSMAVAPVHRALFRFARENRLPFGRGLYLEYGMMRHPDFRRGRIFGLTPEGFVLQNDGGATSSVFFGPRTRRMLQSPLRPGASVMILGREHSEFIEAGGVRVLPE